MSDQTAENIIHKDKRRWWVALLMLFPTGAGYIYVGRPWRFVAYMAFILLIILSHYSATNNLAIFSVPVLVILAAFAIDIVMISTRQTGHNLRWPQRRKWYAASLVLWIAIAFVPAMVGV